MAGLPDDLTFASFRHYELTDAANADLTDAQIRALSGHKTAAIISRYARATQKQRRDGARKRPEARRTKGRDLSRAAADDLSKRQTRLRPRVDWYE